MTKVIYTVEALLTGCRFERESIHSALEDVAIGQYVQGITLDVLVEDILTVD